MSDKPVVSQGTRIVLIECPSNRYLLPGSVGEVLSIIAGGAVQVRWEDSTESTLDPANGDVFERMR